MDDSFLYEFMGEEEAQPREDQFISKENLSEQDKMIVEMAETYFTILGAMRIQAVSDEPLTMYPILFDNGQVQAIIDALNEAYGPDNVITMSISRQLAARVAAILHVRNKNEKTNKDH